MSENGSCSGQEVPISGTRELATDSLAVQAGTSDEARILINGALEEA